MSKLVVRLAIALLFILCAVGYYYSNTEVNPVTGETQHLQISPQDEIALGLEARTPLAEEYGGLYPNPELQRYIDLVGERLVEQSSAAIAPYPFEFHLLADPETVNAFALPGGQVFLTAALLAQMQTEAQLAGVLGHEIAHVVARHGAEHLAREQLGNFLLIAVGVAASSDEANTAERIEILARVVQNLLSLRYSRADETESDRWGFEFMTAAGYSPQGLVEVMAILQAAGGGNLPEFFSSHPNPTNRIQQLESWIQKSYPNGIPPQLETGRDRFQSQIQRLLPGGTR